MLMRSSVVQDFLIIVVVTALFRVHWTELDQSTFATKEWSWWRLCCLPESLCDCVFALWPAVVLFSEWERRADCHWSVPSQRTLGFGSPMTPVSLKVVAFSQGYSRQISSWTVKGR